MSDTKRIIITISCDSTDAWIVAAYDKLENVERIEDPWRNIIAKRKYYHNVKVRREKKSISAYKSFMEQLMNNWNRVTEKCYSARLLEQEVQQVFSEL